jgi:gamma-glutamyl-gamma-aminobutyraldehyde dehydrogenase
VRWYGEAIDKIMTRSQPTRETQLALITREPIGVGRRRSCQWNFPAADGGAGNSRPALAAGNSMVLKPAEQSPLSALRVAELAVEAGIPAGVFNVVPGFRRNRGQALGRPYGRGCARVHRLDGSRQAVPQILRRIQHEIRQPRMRRQTPNIVFADTPDLDDAAKGAGFKTNLFTTISSFPTPNKDVIIPKTLPNTLILHLPSTSFLFSNSSYFYHYYPLPPPLYINITFPHLRFPSSLFFSPTTKNN